MNKNSKGLLFWLPRILAILLILFLAMFSLDVFEMGGGIGAILVGLLMHNLWTIALIVILIFAWKRDLAGVIGFPAFGLVMLVILVIPALGSPGQGAFNLFPLVFMVAFPILIGLLFLPRWLQNRK